MLDKRWELRLRNCQTTQDVVGVVREYVGSLSAEDIAALPEDCAAASVRTASDVATCAVGLTAALAAAPGAVAMHDAASFFAMAARELLRVANQ
jgi:hypothetical protein